MWGKRVAVLTALICALHPFIIWYTPRIWIETLAIFLFTSLIASTLYLTLKPTKTRSIIVGCILGISVLCKQTFLTYIVVIPLFLLCLKHNRIALRYIAYIIFSAVVLILPWTIRNWNLTGKIIPVHVRLWFNTYAGDVMVENYTTSPFALGNLWVPVARKVAAIKQTLPEDLEAWEQELRLDEAYRKESIERYQKNPLFIFKKIICNALMFWTLSETNLKSAVIALMQIPLLLLFTLATIKTIKQKNLRTIQGGTIVFVWLYFLLHLPIAATGRYAIILIPTILTSLGVLMPKLHNRKKAL